MWNNFRKIDGLMDGKISAVLDLIRGVAAVLVLMEHLSAKLFSYGDEGPIIKILYVINLLGGSSVRIFFVLSGLLIARSVLKAIDSGRWSWSHYLANRLSRLYVVLIPALLLTLVLDWLSSLYWGNPHDSWQDNVMNFLGNLFFLQEIEVVPYGSNHPLWSLSYEFWYYLLFPLLLFALVSGQKRHVRWIYLGFAALIFALVGLRISSYFLVWLMGALLLILPVIPIFRKKSAVVVSFVLFVMAMLIRPFVRTGKLPGGEDLIICVDFAIGVTFVAFIYAMLVFYSGRSTGSMESPLPRDGSLFSSISRRLAGFSFSLYLIHQPILDFAHSWANSRGFQGLDPGLPAFATEFALVLIMLAIAWLFASLTEAHTGKVRNAVFSARQNARPYKESLPLAGSRQA